MNLLIGQQKVSTLMGVHIQVIFCHFLSQSDFFLQPLNPNTQCVRIQFFMCHPNTFPTVHKEHFFQHGDKNETEVSINFISVAMSS